MTSAPSVPPDVAAEPIPLATEAHVQRERLTTWQYLWRLLRCDARLFVLNMIAWTAVHTFPLLTGLLTGWFFDALAGHGPLGLNVWAVLAIFAAAGVARFGIFAGGLLIWFTYYFTVQSLLRRNLFAWVMRGPGTHRLPMIDHDDKPDAHNMIKRGQGISERFDGETGVAMPLGAGELSLHHTALVHCSPGNGGDDRRMGLGISFVPAHVRPLGPVKPSALLVRGQDRHGHFLPEARLGRPMSAAARAAHAEAVRLFRLRQDQGFTRAAE